MGGPHHSSRRPTRLAGWTGRATRSPTATPATTSPWAHPNSRFTTTLDNVPNIATDYNAAAGVPIDAIIFGGRTRDREPLIRAITDLAEGVYDGLTLGAEATFAAEGVEGMLRYDPMSNRPFMAYGEGRLRRSTTSTMVGAAKEQPIFAHVNWFQRGPTTATSCGPATATTCGPLLWLLQLKNGEVTGRQTPVGIIPTVAELNLEGSRSPPRTSRPSCPSTWTAGARK